ncbi:hypothetical protein PSPPH_4167 [Pseudomonas savastanoi pv. phaseolicola 1448A]|uniref:Uncharacterized protein n=1 Tax=Pseudomonas savastanoi pv. phaseolicola (strain 1448A / Race 6) TaxID=264730 RepID=Q48E99_PSE14|nr:hypothetical protein PSPPH_4167 [Pseudomonas savastanoi pv. phaseolicola 1448A]
MKYDDKCPSGFWQVCRFIENDAWEMSKTCT